ncbi:MAG: restriction endonuclease subunit S [Pseudomonas proteolytica]|uniref:restriction endonuclease subunit S n=1 Tax=Pseudomonas proteolytica TaxID=219574 RepID=UPI003F307763
MSGSPASWSLVKLGDISEFKYGKALPASVRDGGEFPVYGSNGIVGQHSTWLSVAPTIIIGRKGSVGEVCFSDKNCSPIDTTYYVDSFKFLEPKFCFYLLKTLRLGDLNKSTAIPGLNRQDAYDLEIGLPPLAEQTRIATKLDELLAQVDTLKARIDGIPVLLKRFRQSVLAAAVSGKLTEEWRTKKASEGTTSPNNDWKTIRIDQASADEKYSLAIGPFGSNLKVSDYRDDGKPLVFVREIRAGCFGDKKTKFITPEKFDELSAHQISAGDILVTKMGDPPGDVAIYPATAPDAVITADCIKLRVNESVILREYAYYQMKSNFFRQKVQEISAGVAQQKVSLGNFREITLLVPSREEQREIVRHVGELLAFADQLEARVKAAQVRIDGLTQSILAKAFRGELVPQDPNDEPAGFLLERIKAQRATAPGTKRGRQAATLG